MKQIDTKWDGIWSEGRERKREYAILIFTTGKNDFFFTFYYSVVQKKNCIITK